MFEFPIEEPQWKNVLRGIAMAPLIILRAVWLLWWIGLGMMASLWPLWITIIAIWFLFKVLHG